MSASWHPSPRSQLVLDPFTADIVKWEPFAGQNLGRGAVLVWTRIALAWRRFRSWRSAAVASEIPAAMRTRQEVSAN